jgi:hypothetical protein
LPPPNRQSAAARSRRPVELDDPWGFAHAERAPIARRVPGPPEPVKPPQTRRPSAAWAVLALLAAAAAALAVGGRYVSIGVTARAEKDSGTLVVSSHPAGARVVVDGIDSGLTPLALQLPAGPHSIVLSNTAGVTNQLSADVIAGGSVSRHVLLEPASAPSAAGTIAIESATTGAPRTSSLGRRRPY